MALVDFYKEYRLGWGIGIYGLMSDEALSLLFPPTQLALSAAPCAMYRVWRGVNNMLLSWATKKYKSLKNSRTKAGKLMERIHKEKPGLFIHWRAGMLGAFT